MKKILSLASLLLIIIVVLSGCVSVDYQVTVNKDGSGKISYIYGVQKDYLNKSGMKDEDKNTMVELITSEQKKSAETNGFTVESYSDEEIEGFTATKETENITGEISLAALFGDSYVKDSEDNGIKIEKNFLYTIYSQKTSIDLSNVPNIDDSKCEISYTINLPGSVTNSNATEKSNFGKTLTWKLEPGGTVNIEFEAKESSSNMYLCIAGGVLILLIVILAIVVIIRKSSKKRKEETESDKGTEAVEENSVEEIKDQDDEAILDETEEEDSETEQEIPEENEDKE